MCFPYKGIGETKSGIPLGMVTIKLKDLKKFKDPSGSINERTQMALDAVCEVSKKCFMLCCAVLCCAVLCCAMLGYVLLSCIIHC